MAGAKMIIYSGGDQFRLTNHLLRELVDHRRSPRR
jgi:hypothetical protein